MDNLNMLKSNKQINQVFLAVLIQTISNSKPLSKLMSIHLMKNMCNTILY